MKTENESIKLQLNISKCNYIIKHSKRMIEILIARILRYTLLDKLKKLTT